MKYPFEVNRMIVQGHEFWAAESKALKGCVAQGETLEEALEELEANENEWISTAREYGIAIPEITFEKEETYSGKFTVRLSPFEHRRAAEQAKRQGLSLNQYVCNAIINYTAEERTAGYISDTVDDIAYEIGKRSLTSISYSPTAFIPPPQLVLGNNAMQYKQ